MKKYIFMVFVLLLSLALNAQVSVWDGTAEIWTHGSGTQEDPYLIESAQNLAYLAERTNETLFGYNKYMYADTCFLLTVDLDLGSDNGLEWNPIAQNGTDNMTRVFSGNFDGGGHVISNMKLKNQDGTIFMSLITMLKIIIKT